MATVALESALESALPPTPPSNSEENVQQQKPMDLGTTILRAPTSAAGTPVNARSPPTPDITPPASSLSPPTRFIPSRASGLSSSRAESFRTAREDPWESDGDVSALSQSQTLSNPRLNGVTSYENGLALPEEKKIEDDVTPTQSTQTIRTQSPALNGIADADRIPDREWDTNLMRNVTVRRKKNRTRPEKPRSWADLQPVQEVATPVSPPRVDEPTTPPANRKNGESRRDITWPQMQQNQTPASSQAQDDNPSRRHSGLSSGSTVVEAIIIATPPQQRRQLRHVSKTLSLRSDSDSNASSPVARSRNSSADLGDGRQRLRSRQNSLSGRRPNSTLLESNGRSPITEHRLKHHHDRYSLREDAEEDDRSRPSPSRLSDGKGKSRAKPVGNPHLLSLVPRSTASPPLGTIAVSALRTMSKSPSSLSSSRSAAHRALEGALSPVFAAAHTPSANDSVVTVIKKRSAASDAPSSARSRSRPESTHTYRKSEDLIPTLLENQVTPSFDDHLAVPGVVRRPSDAGSGRSLDRSTIGTRLSVDRSTVRSEDHPRNLYSQSTPFSQLSDLEVTEAKAVSIFPHNNHSLLVVQQVARQSRPSTRHNEADVQLIESLPASEKPLLTIQPSTPPTRFAELMDDTENVETDSPLKNPRRPPQPPTINVLPATPAHEEEDPLDKTNVNRSVGPPIRRLTLMQRARRYSDTIIAPLLLRTNSIRRSDYSKRPGNQSEQARDSHLHPFWHPRGFWDDVSDSDSEWGDGEVFDDDARLPPGGDTSNVEPEPRRLGRVLDGFKGSGGFLMGNSLGLERSGTNNRRHYITLPTRLRTARERDSELAIPSRAVDDYNSPKPSRLALPRPSMNKLMKRRSPSMPSTTASKKSSRSDLRTAGRRRMRRRWHALGLQIEYIGVGGVRDIWRERRAMRLERKAEMKRDEIRRSIGPHVLVENQIAALGGIASHGTRTPPPPATTGTGLVTLNVPETAPNTASLVVRGSPPRQTEWRTDEEFSANAVPRRVPSEKGRRTLGLL